MPDPTLHSRRWWILAVLIVSLFTVNLDNTILNVALPTLARDLHADTSQLQWMVDAYVLLFAGLLLAAGALGDRYGRRRVMLVGLVIFGVGSLASAFAPSATVLILLRAGMGIGGALIVPSTLSVTSNVFSPEERPKAIGIWTGIAGLGIVAGPVLAGWLLEHFAWGSIFMINVPIVLISLVGVVALVPEGRRLFASLTVEENLTLARSAGRAGRWTLEAVMEAFPNLKARRRSLAGTLSGGEQQATAIGRALMTDPEIVLLDEVSLGLSPLVVNRVYEQLEALKGSGVAIVLVEQDLKRAMATASRAICMLEGAIAIEGSTAELTHEEVTHAYFGLRRGAGHGAPA